jgi:zinc transporter ZupT
MDVHLDVWQLVMLWLMTLLAPLTLIALPYIKKKWQKKMMHPMLGISAGLLFGLVFLDIIPEGLELSTDLGLSPMYMSTSVLIGFFVLVMIERYMMKKGMSHGHDANGVKIKPFGTLGIAALSVHGFMDGFVIPIGLSTSTELGIVITVALVAHQIPDSFAALSMAWAAGYNKKKTIIFVLISAFDTPIGMLFGVLALYLASATGVAGVLILLSLGFTAGTFVFVSAADIIPELQHSSQSMSVSLFIVVGFLAVFGLTLMLPG